MKRNSSRPSSGAASREPISRCTAMAPTSATVGETYNVGGGCNEWRNVDIVALICTLMDRLDPTERRMRVS